MSFGISATGWLIGGSVLGGALISADAAQSAAGKQVGAANNATQLQQNIYNQNQANLQPYMQSGNLANMRLADLLGTSGNTGAAGYGALTSNFTGQDYLDNKDPGYQFQLQQGQQALQSSQAATNGVLSGTALKDLIGYNQGMASEGYQNAFNRWQSQQGNIYQRLSGAAGLGENAAAGAGSLGVQSGANEANTITGGANAAAAGQIGSANAINGALTNGMGYYYLNNLTKPPGGGSMTVNPNDQYGYGSGQDLISQFAT